MGVGKALAGRRTCPACALPPKAVSTKGFGAAGRLSCGNGTKRADHMRAARAVQQLAFAG